MNSKQKKVYDQLQQLLVEENKYSAMDAELIRVAAYIRVEMDTLQAYIDKHGTSYEVIGRSGDTYTKHRPEHQQLVVARKEYTLCLKELGLTPVARKRVEEIASQGNELTELLGMK